MHPHHAAERFLKQTLGHIWGTKSWRIVGPDPEVPDLALQPFLWLRARHRPEINLWVLLHTPEQAEDAYHHLSVAAAWSERSSHPRHAAPFLGCTHLFDVRQGSGQLNQVARAGHRLAIDHPNLVYRCISWRTTHDMVPLLQGVEDTEQQITALADAPRGHSTPPTSHPRSLAR